MHLERFLGPRARRAWLGCFVIASLVTLAVALLPAERAPQATGWDKMDHLLAFLGLGVLGVLALRWWRRGIWLVVPILTGLGGLIELGQSFVPSRHADPMDLLADVAGAVLGSALGWAVLTWLLPGPSRRGR